MAGSRHLDVSAHRPSSCQLLVLVDGGQAAARVRGQGGDPGGAGVFGSGAGPADGAQFAQVGDVVVEGVPGLTPRSLAC